MAAALSIGQNVAKWRKEKGTSAQRSSSAARPSPSPLPIRSERTVMRTMLRERSRRCANCWDANETQAGGTDLKVSPGAP